MPARLPYLPGAVPVLDPNAPGQLAAKFLDDVRVRYGGMPLAPFAETWGQYQSDQLGSPVVLTRLSSVVTAVACSGIHYLAVRNGGVYAWGSNRFAQLGTGDTQDRPRPVALAGLSSGVTDVAASSTHSLAIQNGAAYTWGSNEKGQLGSAVPVAVSGLGDGVTAIAAGVYFSLAIRNGAVFGWGSNSLGCLGNVMLEGSSTPVAALGLGNGVSAIAAGERHCLAIRNGALYSWGDNGYGQLGHSGNVMSVMPARVGGFGEHVTAIAAGSKHSLVVCRGVVYTTGSKGFVPVEGVPNPLAVAAGNDCNFALAADGSLWVWGSNLFGALGLGDRTSSVNPPRRRLPREGCKYLSIACGGAQGIGILAATSRLTA